jgi:hypothetical protein
MPLFNVKCYCSIDLLVLEGYKTVIGLWYFATWQAPCVVHCLAQLCGTEGVCDRRTSDILDRQLTAAIMA